MRRIYKMINRTVIAIYIIINLLVNASASNIKELSSIEMVLKNTSPKVGEPLIIELKYIYLKPQISQDSNEIRQFIGSGDISIPLYIKNSSGKITLRTTIQPPLQCVDKKGLIYSGNIILLFDSSSEKAKLLFDESGRYMITIYAEEEKLEDLLGEKAPKPLVVNVRPASRQEEKALSILSGERDLIFLGYSDYDFFKDYPEVLERFKEVVYKCGETMIAKMAAALIGMYLYNEYEEQRLEANLMNQEKPTALRRQAIEYLQKGLELPDEFHIRETILFMLAESDFEEDKRDYLQAKSYLEELSAKYPHGRFGKSAESGIEEVKTMMANDPNWANRAQQIDNKPLGVVLPVAAAAIAGVLIAGFVLFFRKKQKSNDNSSG